MRRDGWCLLNGIVTVHFDVTCRGRHQWHHRLPVEHGGPSVVANGVRVCERHHDRIGSYRTFARANGWLLRPGENPSQVPVTLWNGRRVLLRDDGTYEDVHDPR